MNVDVSSQSLEEYESSCESSLFLPKSDFLLARNLGEMDPINEGRVDWSKTTNQIFELSRQNLY
jgi:hypothetical protein